MSFSSDVRLELSHTHVDKDCCKRAEIAGMLLSSGNLLLTGGGGVALTLSSELAATARHIYLLIKDSFNARCDGLYKAYAANLKQIIGVGRAFAASACTSARKPCNHA